MKSFLILALGLVSVTTALPTSQTPSTVVAQQAVCPMNTPCTHQENCTRFGRNCFCHNGGAEGAPGLCEDWVKFGQSISGGRHQ
ncbi:hypothetical protein MGYG_03478 [Nannizzia gypsea CBS 118893]|uniref:Uncharacterized protein n=1 Tax=Arthroderma gypseum (strain ATCC MYA-4604 / CBS 118893) TaxID=535722 RepID=E4US58_ARTGP|nr:hypothetical protein MGYG_03478 [Nannizzia gypsea CBS 118893]EFR00476.1 hypothetical protein MGYG_03478 [Nannizzia gypsea CBS 118893]